MPKDSRGMKKKKTGNLLDTFKKKTVQKADKYREYEDYEEEYEEEDYLEEDYIEDEAEYYEEEDYMEDDAEYYEEEDYVEDEAGYYEEEEYVEDDSEYYEDEAYEEDDSEYYEDEDYVEDNSEYYEDEAYEEDDAEYYEDEAYTDEYAEDTVAYYEENEYADDNEEYDELYLYEEYDNDEEFDTGYASVNRHHTGKAVSHENYFQESVPEKILANLKDWLKHMTAFDAILGATGVVVLVAALVTFSMLWNAHNVSKQIEAIVPVGTQLSSVGVVGQSGLLAMAEATVTAQQMALEAETESEDISSTMSTDVENAKVSVSFESLERDLKIRFTNAETGKLITGTAFEVVLTNANGKKLVLTDDDMDGVIYATNVNPGKFQAVITSTDKYKFPTTAQAVTVKDKVEYVVINVQDEVKTEAQVNVAAEDTEKVEAVQEEVKLTDTVEWVESTKTLLSGTETYTQVDKSTITDPSTVSSLQSTRMRFDAPKVELSKSSMKLYVGNSDTLTGTSYTDGTSEDGKSKYTYTTEWSSSDTNIATVDGGKVTAKAAGTATITYKVTKKTTTTIPGETTTKTVTEEKEITEEEYNALSEEEKAKCTSKDGGGYIYKYEKEVTKEETGESRTETSEESASATCSVTVEAVKITAASLELARSADACNVKATVTVKPSKLVYTKNDGSTETITSNFPAVNWSSSDTSIATVDSNGVVTGVKAGNVTITGKITGVKGADGNDLAISASTTIKINPAAGLALSLDRTSEVYLAVGGSTTLVATVTNYQSDNGVVWESSDKKIATVNEKGVVTGVAAGSVKITATTKEKDITSGKAVTATCVVTINSNATNDTTTKLKDKDGRQIYVKDKDGNYREAVYADYFTATAFYLKSEGQYAYTGWQTINGKTYYYDKNGKPVTGSQIIQGVTYTFGSDGAIQTNVNGAVFGIDVSKHNGKIDWNAVKASGVDFVIIRCAYRGSSTGALIEDPNFHTNIKGASAAGLKVGIYLFSQAINEVEAVKEASLAVSLAKGYNLTYPIFIDTEASGGRADKIDVATRTAVVNAFCQTVQSAGYKPGIYASKTWYEKKLSMGAIGNYKIWLAQYAATPTYGGRYDMWQYSSKGKINGISGNVDLNYSYLGY